MVGNRNPVGGALDGGRVGRRHVRSGHRWRLSTDRSHVGIRGGGCLPALLKRVPLAQGALAITLGHVVLARSRQELVVVRSHEWIHVLQYEKW